MVTETEIIMEKLDTIRSELDYIKEHMVDIDIIMTIEESKIFEQSMKEFAKGNTISHEKLKKELGL